MIEDYDNIRYVDLGLGTIKVSTDNTIVPRLIFYGCNQQLVTGEYLPTETTDKFNDKMVILNFCGAYAIKSIDVIISELLELKKMINGETKDEV